ncbi:peroxin-6 [Penicillium chrysogenum]|uniref:peroxin-6 n=1 Tax=Penicillium chrysogenum TaxID=5076 RepID=UPI0024DF28A7|nr:peroxin-6 [Penicillium chrysogenum]KAJ5244977.1 peroxin-6 [Penicillium chrysogenum]KAJ5849177.1 peroxin-6 Pex6-Penicillium chrysogenum [Penicillium rubens]
MDFEQYGQSSQQPRQRRRRAGKRRLNNKVPIKARLALDAQLRGKVGILSEDLANDLFQQQALQYVTTSDNGVLYVAIAPHTPTYTPVEDQAWTILPVRIQPTERSPVPMSHSSVVFGESADSLQPFLQALGKVGSSRNSLQAHRSVERHLLRNHDDVQSKFGGGFTNAQGPNGLWGKAGKLIEAKEYSKRAAADAEQRLTAAFREALGAQRIVHTEGPAPSTPFSSHNLCASTPRADLILRARFARLADADDKDCACSGPGHDSGFSSGRH